MKERNIDKLLGIISIIITLFIGLKILTKVSIKHHLYFLKNHKEPPKELMIKWLKEV
jgi:hypothetical protein